MGKFSKAGNRVFLGLMSGLLTGFALFTTSCPNFLNDPTELTKKILQDVLVATAKTLELTVETDPNGISTPSGTLSVKEGIPVDISTNVFSSHAFINWKQSGGEGLAVFDDANSAATKVTITKGPVLIKPVFEVKPKVLYSTPIGASIPKNSRVNIIFSKDIDPLTITDTTLTITENGTGPSLTGQYTITSNTILFSPDSPLNAYKTYVINATTGIKDLLGITLIDNYTSAFKTGNAFDNEPPQNGAFTIGDGVALYTKTRLVTLNNIAADDDSEIPFFQIYNESESPGDLLNFATAIPWTLSADDGEKTISMLFRDLIGNTTPDPVSKTIILDTTPPTATVSINNGDSFTKTASVTLTLSAIDPGTGTKDGSGMGSGFMTLANDSAFTGEAAEAYAETKAEWPLVSGDGSKTVFGKFSDSIGNETVTTISDSIYLDTSAPTGTINEGQTQITNNALVTVTLVLSDGDGSGVDQVKLDSSAVADGIGAWSSSTGNSGDISSGGFSEWVPAAPAFTFTLSATEGTKAINFKVSDKLANESTISSSILYDITAPTFASVSVNGGAISTSNAAVTVAITGAADNNGIANITHIGLANNDAAFSAPVWIPYAASVPWSIENGNNIVYAKLRDAAGNVTAAPVASLPIELDSTPPEGGFTINSNSTYTITAAVTLTSSASPGTTKMRFSDDGNTWPAWTTYSASSLYTLPSGDGLKTIYGQYQDGSGNISATTNDTINLDTSLPVGTITILGTGDGTNIYTNILNPVSLALSASDSGSGLYQMQFSTDNGTLWSTLEPYSATKTGLTLSYAVGQNYSVLCRLQDKAGNTSGTIADTIIYDNVLPIISLFSINAKSAWTNNSLVTLNSTAKDDESGVYQVSISNTSATSRFSTWEAYTSARTLWTLPASTVEGSKQIWIKVRDKAGNEVASAATDTIGLDITVPVITSVTLNSGALTTQFQQTLVTIASGDSGGSGLSQYQQYYNGIYGEWKTLAGGTVTVDTDWPLAANAGSHYVYIKVKDAAGNESLWKYDTITLEVPTPLFAWKGYSMSGTSAIYFTPVTTSGTTTYRFYSTTTANANPNGGDTLDYIGSMTSTVTTGMLASGLASPLGELRYFFVRAYNSDALYGPYSAISVPGWSAHVTVIYNSTNTADTAVAQSIKTLLETNLPGVNSDVTGIQLARKVFLLPESMVASDFVIGTTTEAYFRNIIYGDPVIVTPGSTLYLNLNQTHNLVGGYSRGIIGMGFGGTKLLDTINSQWSAWTLTGQQPADIGYLRAAGFSDSTTLGYTWTTSNTVWISPLFSNYIPGHNTSVQLNYTNFTSRYSVYRLSGATITGGWLYEREPANANYFSVAHQGRFLHFGFSIVPDRPITGKVFFINLIERMDDY